MLAELYANMNITSIIIFNVAIMMIAGFSMTRLTKLLKLPNVTAYIIVGALIGPFCLDLIDPIIIEGMDFLTDIALAFIAFGVGRYFRIKLLKENGLKIVILTLFEVLIPFVLISASMRVFFGFSIEFSLLLGAIGGATAPASTLMTIRQYKAKGNYVNTLLEVIAFDNIFAILLFTICTAIGTGITNNGAVNVLDVVLPLAYNLLVIIVGIIFGLILKKLINSKRSIDNRLLLTIAFLLTITGICTALNISPLLACLAFGATYMNLSNDKNLFNQVNSFSPPIMTLFFVLSGLKLDFSALKVVGFVGLVYFFLRIVAKYFGAWLGAKVTKCPKDVQKYLGLALIPQAGVAIGLATLAQRSLPNESGYLLLTIILAASFLYELVGPASAKYSLNLTKSINEKDFETPKDTFQQLTIENLKNAKYNNKQKVQNVKFLEKFLKSKKRNRNTSENLDPETLFKEEEQKLREKRKRLEKQERKIRNSVKIILLNENNQVLLMFTENKMVKNINKYGNGRSWQLVGGQLQENETILDAAKRELYEEASIKSDEVEFDRIVWHGHFDVYINKELTTINQSFIVAKTKAKNINTKHLKAEEKQFVKLLKWCSLSEIKKFKDIVYPVVLKDYLPDILEGNYPDEVLMINLAKKEEKEIVKKRLKIKLGDKK